MDSCLKEGRKPFSGWVSWFLLCVMLRTRCEIEKVGYPIKNLSFDIGFPTYLEFFLRKDHTGREKDEHLP